MRSNKTMALAAITAALLITGPAAAGKGGKGKPGGGDDGGGGSGAPVELVFAQPGKAGTADLAVCAADGSNSAVILSRAGSSALTPDWSPAGDKIVFNGTSAGTGVYTVAADGTGLALLASTSTDFSAPRWSPTSTPAGGEWIVYCDTAGSQGYEDLFAIRADGTGRVNLTNTPDRDELDPAWSPDADQIAVVVTDYSTYRHILLLDLTASGGTLVASDGAQLTDIDSSTTVQSEAELSWSRDGKAIAFRAYGEETDVWLVDILAPTSLANLTTSSGAEEHAPCWSPDGLELIASRRTFNGRKWSDYELVLMDSVSGNTVPLGVEGLRPAWRR